MKVLIAVDSSQVSENAIGEVVARVWPARSTFDVITVIEPVHTWTMAETAHLIFHSAADLLRSTLERLRAAGLNADGNILHGDPKRAILDRAAETQADLIVVGSNSVSAVEHYFLGNVASNVLRQAPSSVLIARRNGVAGSGPKILLATDGSTSSDAAARSLATRSWPKTAEVRVLSVVEFVLPAVRTLFEPPLVESHEIERIREQAMKHAQDAVASGIAILGKTFANVSESISVLLERPSTLILKEAYVWNADLIVLGSHGRRGADRFLMGSVSEIVATRAHCSVEVIR